MSSVSEILAEGRLDRYLDHFNQEPRLKDYIIQTLQNGYPYSHYKIETESMIKLNNIMDVDYITVVFSATIHHVEMQNPTTTRYGFLFSDSEPVHRYVCTAGTYKSKDGEYRNSLRKFEDWNGWWLTHPYALKLEEFIVQSLGQTLDLRADFCFPERISERERKFYMEKIDSERLAIYIFMQNWLRDRPIIDMEFIEHHTSPAYTIVMGNFGDSVLEEMKKELSDIEIYILSYATTDRSKNESIVKMYKTADTDDKKPVYPSFTGFKLYALSLLERESTEPLSKPWKEYYVCCKINNLIINYVSQSFSFMNSWWFIESTTPGIYENPSNYSRFINPGFETPEDIEAIEAVEEIGGEVLNKQPMSDTVLCLHSEYVGFVIADFPRRINTKLDGIFHQPLEPACFKGHCFEVIYAAYCLQKDYSIIHGDLDDNNVTAKRIYMDNKKENPVVYRFFHIGDYSWAFPDKGWRFHLIDFSRCVFGNIPMVAAEHGPLIADEFHAQQVPLLHKLFVKYAPEFYAANKVSIENAIENRYDEVIRCLGIVDVIGEAMILAKAVTAQSRFPNYKPHEENIAFAQHILGVSQRLFRRDLERLISGDTIKTSAVLEAITELFSDCEVSGLVDQFTKRASDHLSAHPLKYDISSYEKWPPQMRIETTLAAYKKANKPYDLAYNHVLDHYKNNRREESTQRSLAAKKEKRLATGGDEDNKEPPEVVLGGEDIYVDSSVEWMWT